LWTWWLQCRIRIIMALPNSADRRPVFSATCSRVGALTGGQQASIKCLQTAGEVLSSMPGTSEDRNLPGESSHKIFQAVSLPFGHRRVSSLVNSPGGVSKQETCSIGGSVRARTAALRMSAELSTNANDDSKLSFKLPAILFRCAAIEDETMQPCRALGSFTSLYTPRSRIEQDQHQCASSSSTATPFTSFCSLL
jgi:hypothetical protein